MTDRSSTTDHDTSRCPDDRIGSGLINSATRDTGPARILPLICVCYETALSSARWQPRHVSPEEKASVLFLPNRKSGRWSINWLLAKLLVICIKRGFCVESDRGKRTRKGWKENGGSGSRYYRNIFPRGRAGAEQNFPAFTNLWNYLWELTFSEICTAVDTSFETTWVCV